MEVIEKNLLSVGAIYNHDITHFCSIYHGELIYTQESKYEKMGIDDFDKFVRQIHALVGYSRVVVHSSLVLEGLLPRKTRYVDLSTQSTVEDLENVYKTLLTKKRIGKFKRLNVKSYNSFLVAIAGLNLKHLLYLHGEPLQSSQPTSSLIDAGFAPPSSSYLQPSRNKRTYLKTNLGKRNRAFW